MEKDRPCVRIGPNGPCPNPPPRVSSKICYEKDFPCAEQCVDTHPPIIEHYNQHIEHYNQNDNGIFEPNTDCHGPNPGPPCREPHLPCQDPNLGPPIHHHHHCEQHADIHTDICSPEMRSEITDILKECRHRDPFVVTDEDLLDFLLKRYRIDKKKLIAAILKQRHNEFRCHVLKDFYEQNRKIIGRCIKDQYQFFKRWNNSGMEISREELEDYFHKYINK